MWRWLTLTSFVLATLSPSPGLAESANRLALEARQIWNQAQSEPNPQRRLELLEDVLEIFERIVEDFPDSDRAVQVIGDESVAGLRPSEVLSEKVALQTSSAVCFASPSIDCLMARAVDVARHDQTGHLFAEIAQAELMLGRMEGANAALQAGQHFHATSSVEALILRARLRDSLGDRSGSLSEMEAARRKAAFLDELALVMFGYEHLDAQEEAASTFQEMIKVFERRARPHGGAHSLGRASLSCADGENFYEMYSTHEFERLTGELARNEEGLDCLSLYFDREDSQRDFLTVLTTTKLARLTASLRNGKRLQFDVEKAKVLIGQMPRQDYRAWGLAALAEVYQARGNPQMALALLEQAIATLEQIKNTRKASETVYVARLAFQIRDALGIVESPDSLFQRILGLDQENVDARVLVALAEVAHEFEADAISRLFLSKFLASKDARFNVGASTRAAQLLIDLGDRKSATQLVLKAWDTEYEKLTFLLGGSEIVDQVLGVNSALRSLATISVLLARLTDGREPGPAVGEVPTRLGPVLESFGGWALGSFPPILRIQAQLGDIRGAIVSYEHFLRYFGPFPQRGKQESYDQDRRIVAVRGLIAIARALHRKSNAE